MSVKRRRLLSSFFRLPHEVLEILLSELSITDLVNLGSCSKEYYKVLKPYIYNCICLSWNDLLSLEKGGLENISDVVKFVECVKIKEYNIRNEWSYDYEILNKKFTNMTSLKMHISNSSNFLKYLQGDGLNLEKLELIVMNRESNLFNIDHLSKISVRHLKLDGFLIDFEDIDKMITSLELVNCYWNYPFELDQFKNLIVLTLNYSNEFIISERFRGFLMNPTLLNLEILKIINNNQNLKLYIPGKSIKNIADKLPKLREIQLEGNVITSPPSKPITKVNVRVCHCSQVHQVRVPLAHDT